LIPIWGEEVQRSAGLHRESWGAPRLCGHHNRCEQWIEHVENRTAPARQVTWRASAGQGRMANVNKLMVSVAVLTLCATAYGAQRGGGGTRPGGGGVSVTMDPKTDQVLTRLGLTDAQITAIEKINTEADGKKAELDKADPKPKGKELQDKLKAIQEETRKKVREALTAEQQPKFDAGMTAVADRDAKVKAARDEMNATVKADNTKKDEAKKTCDDKIAAAKTDLEKALDEKVGKAGAAATK